MSNLTKDDLKKYANKLMFDMTDDEYETLLDEFSVIIEQMESINNIKGIKEVEPQVFPFINEDISLRKDESKPSISIEDAFANAKDVENNEIRVPKVVE
jgi:aspartyl/glutamyl-tRNA(Asn/Gln) amidotransferase C subunit